MYAAFLEALPIAIGLVLATSPLIGVALLLVNRPDRRAYIAFLGGWAAGAAVIGFFAIAVSDLSAPAQQPPAIWVIWLRLILGLCLIALAVRKITRRSARDGDNEPPKWMLAFKQMPPLRTFGLGAGLAALNPKNAALFISGALTIAAATYAPPSQIVAFAVFVAVSSMGLALPLVLSAALGARADWLLNGLSDLMARYSTLIVALVLAILGGITSAKAFSDLWSDPGVEISFFASASTKPFNSWIALS